VHVQPGVSVQDAQQGSDLLLTPFHGTRSLDLAPMPTPLNNGAAYTRTVSHG
jgi:hypothetical protein